MPSPILALDLIKTAMRLKGIIATGETPSAEKATDGLRALNDVLETWSNQSYAVWGSLPETFAIEAGKSTYSVGPGGDWNTDRPTSIASATIRWQGVDFDMRAWTLDEYMAIGIKSIRTETPERFVFVNDAPLAQVILYPTPASAATVTLNTPRILQQVPSVSTVLTLPPGYARALQYAVAEELGPQYGSPIDLSAAARSTLALLKRANRQSPIARMDPAIIAAGGRVGGGRGFYG